MNKEIAIHILNDFPQEFDLEELIEKLIFVEKVEKGLKKLEVGKFVSHKDMKQIMKKW